MASNNSTLLRDHSSLNGDNSLLNSYDDGEESFVVLERSTANDFDIGLDRSSLAQSFRTTQDDNSLSVFHYNLHKGMSTSSSNKTQEIPGDNVDCSVATSVSAEEIDKRLKEVLQENIILKENLRQTNLAMKQQLSTVSLVQDRAVEAQKKQQQKFEETKALILKLGSEKGELVEANEALTQEISKLKEDNKELSKTNFAFGEETSKLVSENALLKSEMAALRDTLEIVSENRDKYSLQKEKELRETVEQLSRKLEAVERARRQLEFDIDRLQAQLGRASMELVETQRKLAHAESTLQKAESESLPNLEQTFVSPVPYNKKLQAYEELLFNLKSTFEHDQAKTDSLSSWLCMTDPSGSPAQFEVSELRRLLSQEQAQSVAQKETSYRAASAIQEMLGDIKKLREELELVKADTAVKESHSLVYEEMKKKGYIEKIDELTAALVEKEEALAIVERHLASLQEAVRLHNQDKQGQDIGVTQGLKEEIENLKKKLETKEQKIKANEEEINGLKTELRNLQGERETAAVFEEQAKIYQADFEAERKSREALFAEKDRILEDLRHLQRRNEDLLGELNRTRDELNVVKAGQHSHEPFRPPERVSQPSAPPPRLAQISFVCPISNCKRWFESQEKLNKHMFVCWGKQYTSTFSLARAPKYGCDHAGCQMNFRTKDEYTLHLKFQHSDNKQSRCEIPSDSHQEHSQHPAVSAVGNSALQAVNTCKPDNLYCPSCDYPFENEELLTHHVYSCWGIND